MEASRDLLVRLFDNNNAPREEITIHPLITKPVDAKVDLVLDCSPRQKVALYTAEIEGKRLDWPQKYTKDQLKKKMSLWVQGLEASESMKDITISISALGKELASVKFTVIWAELPKPQTTGTPPPAAQVMWPDSGDKKDPNKIWFGWLNYRDWSGPAIGYSFLVSAEIQPSHFKDSELDSPSGLRLHRDAMSRDWALQDGQIINKTEEWWNFGGDAHPNDDGHEIGKETFHVDAPDINNKIYILVSPGMGLVTNPSTIIRMRTNFRVFVGVNCRGPGRSERIVRCSPVLRYGFACSLQQISSPDGHLYIWNREYTAKGDNELELQKEQIGLGWDLSPIREQQ
jgi:hypothetical protein